MPSISRAQTETVRFGIDGVEYQAHLSVGDAAKLRAELGPFIEAVHRAAERDGRLHEMRLAQVEQFVAVVGYLPRSSTPETELARWLWRIRTGQVVVDPDIQARVDELSAVARTRPRLPRGRFSSQIMVNDLAEFIRDHQRRPMNKAPDVQERVLAAWVDRVRSGKVRLPDDAARHFDELLERTPPNRGGTNAEDRVDEYLDFVRRLDRLPRIRGPYILPGEKSLAIWSRWVRAGKLKVSADTAARVTRVHDRNSRGRAGGGRG